jgi:hypothetical protein
MFVLSLFDFSGNWPRPYADAGYDVYLVDLKHGSDVLQIDERYLDSLARKSGKCRAVLAAPPCTDFSGSGAQYWPAKDACGSTAKCKTLVRAALDIIVYLKPPTWALENPVGRLNTLFPVLKRFGPWYFNPCDYGGYLKPGEKSFDHPLIPARDAYAKKTGIWGVFEKPEPKPVEPIFKITSSGDRYSPINMGTGGKSERTKQIRSTTPLGFARAFYAANP